MAFHLLMFIYSDYILNSGMTSVDFFLYSLSKLYTILAVAAVVDVAVFLVTAYLLCLLTLIIS